jgi:hypothetical protein
MPDRAFPRSAWERDKAIAGRDTDIDHKSKNGNPRGFIDSYRFFIVYQA